jgi:hypothetical protein
MTSAAVANKERCPFPGMITGGNSKERKRQMVRPATAESCRSLVDNRVIVLFVFLRLLWVGGGQRPCPPITRARTYSRSCYFAE